MLDLSVDFLEYCSPFISSYALALFSLLFVRVDFFVPFPWLLRARTRSSIPYSRAAKFEQCSFPVTVLTSSRSSGGIFVSLLLREVASLWIPVPPSRSLKVSFPLSVLRCAFDGEFDVAVLRATSSETALLFPGRCRSPPPQSDLFPWLLAF